MPPEPVSRRTFLTATGGLVVAAAGVSAAGLSAAGASPTKSPPISPLVLSSDLYASPEPQRLTFALAKGRRYASFAPAKVALAPPESSDGTVYATELHKQGLPKGRGIYVADVVLPTEGAWNALAITGGKRVPFAIQVKPQAEAPVTGAAAPNAPSPTTVDPLGVKPICTRRPACPLHDQSLSDVVGTGRPVAALFATPALCQSQYCGPVLDELLKIMPGYRDRVTFVHVEIYRSNRGVALSPTVEAWGLPSEPWLYGIDGTGTITGRLDGAFGGDEMTDLIDTLVTG